MLSMTLRLLLWVPVVSSVMQQMLARLWQIVAVVVGVGVMGWMVLSDVLRFMCSLVLRVVLCWRVSLWRWRVRVLAAVLVAMAREIRLGSGRQAQGLPVWRLMMQGRW